MVNIYLQGSRIENEFFGEKSRKGKKTTADSVYSINRKRVYGKIFLQNAECDATAGRRFSVTIILRTLFLAKAVILS
jgi:hypothetical protein